MLELIRKRLPKETMIPVALVLLVFSWGLYPMMGVVWFFPEIRYVVLMLFMLLAILCMIHKEKRNNFELPLLIRWVIGLYLIYYVSLGAASVASGDSFSMIQYAKYEIYTKDFIFYFVIKYDD